jgi:phosphate transport system protein
VSATSQSPHASRSENGTLRELTGPPERGAGSDLSRPENRERFRAALKKLEESTLDALDLVVGQLERALEAISYQDVELAGLVVTDDDQIDRRYVEVHRGILSLLAHQATPTDELRTATALLHTLRCVERMGDQCANIAKLVPLSGHAPPKDKDILDAIERMGQLARSQTIAVREAFGARNLGLARDLVRQDSEINRLNRAIFRRAVEVGDNLEMREWAMFMILVARCLERIGDNTVDIAGQAVFVITGMFWEPSGAATEAEPGSPSTQDWS